MKAETQSLRLLEAMDTSLGDVFEVEFGDFLRVLPERREVRLATIKGDDRPVVLKCYLTHPKQIRDWVTEWNGLCALKERGLPAPVPVATAQNDAGDRYVVMSRIKNADTLGAYLVRADAADVSRAMSKLVQVVQAVHDSGALQKDQHINNWAIADGAIYVLDAGSFKFSGNPLGRDDRLQDLASICVTLPPHAEVEFRRVLVEAYQFYSGLAFSAEDTRALDKVAEKTQIARAKRYYKKTQRLCTEFEPKAFCDLRGMSLRTADAELIDSLLQEPDELMDRGERVKSGNTCSVQCFEWQGSEYVLKRYNRKSFWVRWRRSFLPSRAQRSWSNGWILNLSFIPSAEPIAFLDQGRYPRNRSFFLMRKIDALLLPDYVKRYRADEAKMNDLAAEIERIWFLLGRLRASHGDMKATNWMVDAHGRVYLFDLDAFRFGLSVDAFTKGRAKDKRRFLKNWMGDTDLLNLFCERMERAERK